MYKQFLAARPNIQHFACHSHHYWPDVTRQAMLDYWDDTASMVDEKWDHIFADKLPATQKLIAKSLNLTTPERIVFAPNTHELLYRIYSSFDPAKKIKILTTDSEFYSFQRQSERLEQAGLVEITRITTEPFSSFEQRFTEVAQKDEFDWVFVSQVFFNSGYAINDLADFVQQLPTQPLITIDGYHGFFAIPTDLSEIEQKVFYLAGSYKYAQGGEGACFAVVPDGNYQPIYTGWFAEFGDLHQRQEGHVGYAKNGQQFAGATIDFSAMYRLYASLTLFEQEGLSIEVIHKYVEQCQQAFLQQIDELKHPLLNRDNLLSPNHNHGHFLTFNLDEDDVVSLAKLLDSNGIKTDFRGNRLRFGFAIYHDPTKYDLTCLRQG
ncbi:aminotransferase class V-fold PLP-dependent enzyme [Psychrosphaera sp. F3M07]|uniref:aminotransferase class V-fold PLP-dependent enzyme n=1 Tax=Psychrosphaera sp. F3M07 TaxID=2841560 RepID=UPI00353023A9